MLAAPRELIAARGWNTEFGGPALQLSRPGVWRSPRPNIGRCRWPTANSCWVFASVRARWTSVRTPVEVSIDAWSIEILERDGSVRRTDGLSSGIRSTYRHTQRSHYEVVTSNSPNRFLHSGYVRSIVGTRVTVSDGGPGSRGAPDLPSRMCRRMRRTGRRRWRRAVPTPGTGRALRPAPTPAPLGTHSGPVVPTRRFTPRGIVRALDPARGVRSGRECRA